MRRSLASRVRGGVACLEVYDHETLKGYPEFARKRGVFSRPFKNIVYTTPPYIIEEEALIRVLRTMTEFFATR